MILSIWTISPTPLAGIQPQNRTNPPTMYQWRPQILPSLLNSSSFLDPKIQNLDSSVHNTLCHWLSLQTLWALAYSLFILFPFRKSGLLSTTLPQRPILIKLFQSCHMLSQILAGLLPVGQRANSEKPLIPFWNFLGPPVLFRSMTPPDSAWIPDLECAICLLMCLWK